MASNPSPLLFLLPFLLLSSLSSAFNITAILDQYPDFANFNSLLSQTKLADKINKRVTLTVLAVDSSGLASVSGLPVDELERILSVHVILDYFDMTKLKTINKKSTSLTTLYQTTGTADQRQGFLNMTKGGDGKIAFGSAMPGSPINSNLVKSIMNKPYNISVLQVSSVIVPPGVAQVNDTKASSPPAPATGAAGAKQGVRISRKTPRTPRQPNEQNAEKVTAPAAEAPTADCACADAAAARCHQGLTETARRDADAGPCRRESGQPEQVAIGAGLGGGEWELLCLVCERIECLRCLKFWSLGCDFGWRLDDLWRGERDCVIVCMQNVGNFE
ncbi:fasciclin-like arabinogalactan protein 14 [Asparagus officinalis]|uniref:fasciclin-like arabinogalactan protein 14 n=1 Tax=Asparagus officinalis TaxID=4686 RepID=UPI00098DE7BD|nr:fasciclin-like arabinogalactan protein 14 [Asparagus officinalis]